MIPIYAGYAFTEEGICPGHRSPGDFLNSTLVLMLSMIFSINPLPNAVKIPGTNVANK